MPTSLIHTDKDATIDAESSDGNFGGDVDLEVESSGGLAAGDVSRFLVGFDPSGFTAEHESIDKVELLVAWTSTDGDDLGDPVVVEVYELTESWSEDAVTWNTQPAAESSPADTDTAEADRDSAFVVTSRFQDAFANGNRLAFRVRDEDEARASSTVQLSASREDTSGEVEPRLRVTYFEEQVADLSSSLEVRPTEDLPASVRVWDEPGRWSAPTDLTPTDPGGTAVSVTDLAWDPDRGVWWFVDSATESVFKADDDLDASVEASPTELDYAPTGVAYDAGEVWTCKNDSTRIDRFSVDADDAGLTHEHDYSDEGVGASHLCLSGDGSFLWALHVADGELKRIDHGDASLSVPDSRTFDSDIPWGVAVAEGESGVFTTSDDDAAGDNDLARHDEDDLTETDRWDLGIPGAASGVAFWGREAGYILLGETGGQNVQRFPSMRLPSSVEVGRERRTSDLAGTVRPALSQVSHVGRGVAQVVWGFPRDPIRDLEAISAQAGDVVTRTQGGVTRDLRRVVQVQPTTRGRDFPRSGSGDRDRLRRGDAILFALGRDTWEPGAGVAWQGRDWTVMGVLEVERLRGEAVYREVGLRRDGTVGLGRATGTVQRAAHGDATGVVTVRAPAEDDLASSVEVA